MILVLVIWLIDGFLLSVLYAIIAAIINKNMVHLLDWLIIGFITTTVFMLVGVSKIGFYLLKGYLGCRFAINRELQRIDPLLLEVINKSNEVYRHSYQFNNINILIADSKIPDSQAIGSNSIILTDGLLKYASDEELKGVLAYHLGHLYYKDSIRLSSVIFGTVTTKIISLLYTGYINCYKFLVAHSKKFGNKGLHFIPFLAIIPLVIFLPIIALNWLVKQFYNINLYIINRRYVYKADKFAKELGYGPELVRYLETRYEITYVDQSIMGRIFAAYPPIMERISRLEAGR